MTYLLVDGHYYAYRSFHAIPSLTNSKGEPTNAIFGFAKALKKMIADVKPDAGTVIFDGGLPADRLALQPEYKANRSETPEDLSKQLDAIQAVGPALGLPMLCVDGEEADDLLGCYARAAGPEDTVVIATNDKDIMQMVNDRVKIYASQGTEFKLLGPAEVEEKWGVPPEKIGDVLSLTGDAVDNIPGVPGIGPKTAAALIREFGTVENVLTRWQEIKSEKTRMSIDQHRVQVLSNQGMVRLKLSLDLPLPLEALKLKPDYAAQIDLFSKCEFKTFTAEAKDALEKSTRAVQQNLF
jgi:DNA polymerase-1